MAAQKKNKNIRKFTPPNGKDLAGRAKLGGHSLGVTIPIDIVRKLNWKERQKVVVDLRGKKIVIEDWQEKSR